MSSARNPDDVLYALKAACLAHPSQRVTQVIVNALGADPFYVEDTDAARRLREYASVGMNRGSAVTDDQVCVSRADLALVLHVDPSPPSHRDGACVLCGSRSVAHYCRPRAAAEARLRASVETRTTVDEAKAMPYGESSMSDDLTGLLDSTAFLLPNLNDTFAYACADTEQIAVGEGEVMAAWWRRHGWHGLVALAAWKRGRHPLRGVADDEQYDAALRDLASDEVVCCDGEDEGGTWLWWFDLDEKPALTGERPPEDGL